MVIMVSIVAERKKGSELTVRFTLRPLSVSEFLACGARQDGGDG